MFIILGSLWSNYSRRHDNTKGFSVFCIMVQEQNSDMINPTNSHLSVSGNEQEPVLRLGISACLLGHEVRYNSGHKRDDFLVHTLGSHVRWYPLCPEVEIGLGIPRESIRLAGNKENPRLIAPQSGKDHTQTMNRWARSRLDEIEQWRLHGYVLKKDSPSCGLFRVRVYRDKGAPARDGRGLFAGELTRRLPLLPVEEEGRLNDPRLRENFIERLFAYQRWRHFMESDPTPKGLVQFHTAHKLIFLAHSPQRHRELGRLAAAAGHTPWPELINAYGQIMADIMKVLATPGRHANVLHHLMSYLKKFLSADEKQELLGLIDDYAGGLVPLIVPVTLLKHHLRRHEMPDWIGRQAYLNPYPKELTLRNHV